MTFVPAAPDVTTFMPFTCRRTPTSRETAVAGGLRRIPSAKALFGDMMYVRFWIGMFPDVIAAAIATEIPLGPVEVMGVAPLVTDAGDTSRRRLRPDR